ncbi:MAG: hypothetical protein RR022_01125 [Angelakisella sp.]
MKLTTVIEEQAGAAAVLPRRRIWPFFMLGLLLCYLLVSGWVLGMLWENLADYQQCLPQSVAQGVLDKIKSGDYALLEGADRFSLSPYEDVAAQQKYLAARFAPVDKLAPEKKANAEGQLLYHALAGGKRVATITLTNSGWLSPHGRVLYTAQSVSGVYQAYPPCTITAPGKVALLVNGKPLDKPTTVTVADAQFADLPGQLPPPERWEYQLSGLLYQPEITLAPGQPACTITENEQGTQTVLVRELSPARRTEITQLATTIAKLQARFMSRDARRADLYPYLLPDGPAVRTLRQLDNSWYIDHQSYAFEHFEVTNMVEYDENRISCEVSFDYIVTHGKKVHTFPTAYTLYFTRLSPRDKFLLAQLTVR